MAANGENSTLRAGIQFVRRLTIKPLSIIQGKTRGYRVFAKFTAFLLALLFLSGCASVPTANQNETEKTKQFGAPSDGHAGIYIYRKNSAFGGALKKDVWIDGRCIGETAPGIFFYEEVTGSEDHKISTESEFSPNDLVLTTQTGKNYFVEQYIKMGAFVGGANVQAVDEVEGKTEVAKLEMAAKGNCSK